MEFAMQIGKLPYSWRIVSGAPAGGNILAQVEIADADGVVHAVPDTDGNPAATFGVEVSFDPSVDNQALIDREYSLVRNALWLLEAGSAEAAFAQIVAQNYRRPL
jgi:hypothetical protein